MAVFDAHVGLTELRPAFYLFISFVSYLMALNLQSYKSVLWHDTVADALTEVGSFCLLTCYVLLVVTAQVDNSYKLAVGVIAATAWVVNHLIGTSRWWRLLGTKEVLKRHGIA